ADYGGAAVLNGVSLALWPGEIAVLMGRNGVGKSTLLRCIVGLLRPRRGSVRIAGQSTSGRSVAAISRLLAMLPQDPDSMLFADTVAEELRITLRTTISPSAISAASAFEMMPVSPSMAACAFEPRMSCRHTALTTEAPC
ncbi:MAG: ATP-binding cassette domain-containing protein, partial [Synechococcaceae cyanobacterium SM2_3_60]|nr:ATP-binding cassette domain-containing protein [Synechococcaceae cyanobacterium SM2_3_60]